MPQSTESNPSSAEGCVAAEFVPSRPSRVRWKIRDGKARILDETSMLRGLNDTGTRIWELIDGQRNVREIAGMLAREFAELPPADELERDIGRFVARLERLNLLEKAVESSTP